MTLASLRTPGIIVSFVLGLWFVSQSWGVIAILCWAGTAKLISTDKYSQASEDIFTVIFLLILAGLVVAAVKGLLSLLF